MRSWCRVFRNARLAVSVANCVGSRLASRRQALSRRNDRRRQVRLEGSEKTPGLSVLRRRIRLVPGPANTTRSRSTLTGTSLRGRREQIASSTTATSAAAAGRGSVLGTSRVSMRSIGLAPSRSCRTVHLQNDATAARLRLRMDGACPAISPRNAPNQRRGQPRDVAAVMGGEGGQVAAVGADVLRGLFALARSVRKSSMWRASGCSGSTARDGAPTGGAPPRIGGP